METLDVRVSLLEAKVKLISTVLKGTIAVIVGAIVTYFVKG